MKTTTILGIALIVLGVVAFAYEGISYTTRENVITSVLSKPRLIRKRPFRFRPLSGGWPSPAASRC